MSSAALTACPVCRRAADVCPLLEKDGYQIHRCSSCDHMFVYPVPGEEELSNIYTFAEGYHCGQPTLPQEVALPERFLEAIATIERYASPSRLLDVGCSTGTFLHLAGSRGWSVKGIEFSEDTSQVARAAGLDVVTGTIFSLNPARDKFDALHLAEVIEHVADPRAMLEQARRLLNPGGVLYVTTPNSDAFWPKATYLIFRLIGVPWSHVTPPHHLHQFSAKSLRKLLDDTGFRCMEVSYAPSSLRYELGETHVRKSFVTALKKRDATRALARGFQLSAALVAYPALHLLDRLVPKTKDAQMRCLAVAAGS